MSGKSKKLKKYSAFIQEDIDNIVQLGVDKYTVKEISTLLQLDKQSIQKVLDEHGIIVPKKPNNIQRLYDQGKLNTNQFFQEASALIKSRLMPELIYKGYYRDGERQISYNQEDVDDCYTYILRKIIDKYDPKKGTLATFIRNWVRGYGTTITASQHRRYNKVGNDSSLDENYNNSIREEFRDSFTYEELEESIDEEYYNEENLRCNEFVNKEMIELKNQFFKHYLRNGLK